MRRTLRQRSAGEAANFKANAKTRPVVMMKLGDLLCTQAGNVCASVRYTPDGSRQARSRSVDPVLFLEMEKMVELGMSACVCWRNH